MFYLKRAIELFNKKDATGWGVLDYEQILYGVQAAKVFVCIPKDSGLDIGPIEQAGSQPFSLPFKVCWFEVLNGGLSIWDMPAGQWSLKGLLIEEFAPERFNYVLYIEQSDGYSRIVALHDDMEHPSQETRNLLKVARESVFQIVSRINRREDETGFVTNHEKLKIKTPTGKIFHKVRKIIYVVHKKSRGAPIEGVSQSIDWSHRWLVRGHWRAITGLGKDRDGDYCVHGFTWVTEHSKGPEDKPLVTDKTRIVVK